MSCPRTQHSASGLDRRLDPGTIATTNERGNNSTSLLRQYAFLFNYSVSLSNSRLFSSFQLDIFILYFFTLCIVASFHHKADCNTNLENVLIFKKSTKVLNNYEYLFTPNYPRKIMRLLVNIIWMQLNINYTRVKLFALIFLHCLVVIDVISASHVSMLKFLNVFN